MKSMIEQITDELAVRGPINVGACYDLMRNGYIPAHVIEVDGEPVALFLATRTAPRLPTTSFVTVDQRDHIVAIDIKSGTTISTFETIQLFLDACAGEQEQTNHE